MTTKLSFRALPPKLLACFMRGTSGMSFVVLFSHLAIAQTSTIYTQPFSGTLAASGWTSTNLTAPWGNGSFLGISNTWQVSDSESGMSANTCGTGGAGDRSLYMGATALASGAAYLSDVNTNRRIASANINTTGYTTVTVEFDFIGRGEGTTDRAYFVYSVDGGTTYTVPTGAVTSSTPAMGTGGDINNLKSQLCGAQGLWTHVTWTMPASCEGITNLRVGFIWQSNNNSVGSDPSFAVDDVTVTAILTPAPIELVSFTAEPTSDNKITLNWITASEQNNDYYTIERSQNASDFMELFKMDGAGNSSQLLAYSAIDAEPLSGISYYRLKQTDYNGDFKYSSIQSVELRTNAFELLNCYPHDGQIEISLNLPTDNSLHVQLYSMEGKLIISADEKLEKGQQKLLFPIQNLSKGLYLLSISDLRTTTSRKIVF